MFGDNAPHREVWLMVQIGKLYLLHTFYQTVVELSAETQKVVDESIPII